MKKKTLNILKYVLVAALTVVLVYLALRGMDWGVFIRALGDTSWGWVTGSLAFAFLALVFRTERWRALMLPINGEVRRKDLWDACSIGNLFSLVIPWMSFLVRCGVVTDKKTPYDKTVGTIIMERAWDMLMVLILIILAIILKSGEIAQWFIDNIAKRVAGRFSLSLTGILVAVVAIAALLIFLCFKFRDRNAVAGKIAGWTEGIFEGFKTFGKAEHKTLFILYTVGIWISYVMMCFCVFRAIPVLSGLDFTDALFISVVGNLSSLLPVPGGFGAYHYAVAVALSTLYGAEWEIGILFATLTHETRAIMLAALGAVSMISSQKKIKIQ